MKNIMILPLDERPCNVNYVEYLAKDTEYNLLIPGSDLLGNKKKAANLSNLKNWILKNINNMDYLLLSIDMLVYGGIVPSRLHYKESNELLEQLSFIKEIKDINPDLVIYAFNLIMRNPTYSSSDEEPDYYEDYGREIHLKGVYEHKKALNIENDIDDESMNKIQEMPEDIYFDYIDRRRKNLEVNKEVINLLQENIIDYLVIPQDDASPFGLTKIDQEKIKEHIIKQDFKLAPIMYPEADGVINALFVRAVNDSFGVRPRVYVEYTTKEAENVIPKFEDRALSSSISSHIEVTNCVQTQSINQADIILMINAAGVMCHMHQVKTDEEQRLYDARNLEKFIANIENYIEKDKNVVIADLAYPNGSDEELINLLNTSNILFELAGYAAWNTSGNTLGTCLPQGIVHHYYGKTESHMNFLAHRYVEDYIYMTKARKYITESILPDKGYNYFDIGEKSGEIADITKEVLIQYVDEFLSLSKSIKIKDVFHPWKRMFEVAIRVEYNFDLELHRLKRLDYLEKKSSDISADIVFLGDSITESFKLKKYFQGVEVFNSGICGDNTDDVLSRLHKTVLKMNPSKILLLIGTNDLCDKKGVSYIVNNILKITKSIKDYDQNIQVYLQSIYPVSKLDSDGVNNIYIECRSNSDIDSINKKIQEDPNSDYIDVSSILKSEEGLKNSYTSDGLHLNSQGYDVVAEVLIKFLR